MQAFLWKLRSNVLICKLVKVQSFKLVIAVYRYQVLGSGHMFLNSISKLT